MKNEIIEGTLAEVQRKMGELDLDPQARLFVAVSVMDPAMAAASEYFANAPRKNGIIQISSKGCDPPLTIDRVKELSED